MTPTRRAEIESWLPDWEADGSASNSEIARAFRELLAEVPEWRPIESALKDVEILVYGHWEGEINERKSKPSAHVVRSMGATWAVTGTDYYSAWVNATHWMPLPEPPA